MSHSRLPKSDVLWSISRTLPARATNLGAVTTQDDTHFVTGGAQPHSSSCSNEWSGVVELREPLTHGRANRELRALLAQSFDLDSEDIRILHWARLH
jgi:hypothetical protein